MKPARNWTVAAFAAAVLVAGCASGCAGGPDVDSQAPKPEAVSFGGQFDPRFVGKWTSSDSNSTVEMLKDGNANLVTVTHSPNGKAVEKVSGKWLVRDSDLLFEYSDKSKQLVVVKYGFELSGRNMTLKQAGGRIKTKYTRSPS